MKNVVWQACIANIVLLVCTWIEGISGLEDSTRPLGMRQESSSQLCHEFQEDTNPSAYCQTCLTKDHCAWDWGIETCINKNQVGPNDWYIFDPNDCEDDEIEIDRSCSEFGEQINPLKYCQVCLERKHCAWNSGKKRCVNIEFVEEYDRIINNGENCEYDLVTTDLRCEQIFDFEVDVVTSCRLCLNEDDCSWNSDTKTCIYIDVATASNIGLITKSEQCEDEILDPDTEPTCKDLNTMCPHWVKIGGCTQQPEYMLENCKASCKVCIPEVDCKQISPGNQTWTTAFYCITCTTEWACAFSIDDNSCVNKDKLEMTKYDNNNYIEGSEFCVKDIYEFGCLADDKENIEPPNCQSCLSRKHCVWHWQIMNCVNREFLTEEGKMWFNDDPSLCELDSVNTACNEKFDGSKNKLENCLSCNNAPPICSFVQSEGKFNCIRRNISFADIINGALEINYKDECTNTPLIEKSK